MATKILWSGAIVECGWNESNYENIKVNNREVRIHLPKKLIDQLHIFMNKHPQSTPMLSIVVEV